MRADIAKILLGFLPKSNPTRTQIKEAYRKAAFETHPDRAANEAKAYAESKFKLISECYEYLDSGVKEDPYAEENRRREAESQAAEKQRQEAAQRAAKEEYQRWQEDHYGTKKQKQKQGYRYTKDRRQPQDDKGEWKAIMGLIGLGWIFAVINEALSEKTGEDENSNKEEEKKTTKMQKMDKAKLEEMSGKTPVRVKCPSCGKRHTVHCPRHKDML